MFGNVRSSSDQRTILKNLDILTKQHQHSGSSEETPTLEKAYKQLGDQMVRDKDGKPYTLTCDLDEFKKYGPGVYLMFRFIKYLLLVMGLLLPLPLTNIILLINSEKNYDGTNFQTMMESTTISSMYNNSTLVTTLNFIVVLFLAISMIYWEHLQTTYVLECSKQACLTSYFTVILKKIPNYYSEQDFKEYLEDKYGKVHEIYTVKNYEEDLNQYKEIHEIVEKFKEERQFYLKHRSSTNIINLANIFLEFRKKHKEISCHIIENKIYEPCFTFVTFENVMQRWKILEDQEVKMNNCWGQPEETSAHNNSRLFYKDQKLLFTPCQMQPDGIIWQNLNQTRKHIIMRCFLIAFLLSLFLFLSITIMFIFAAAESGLYMDQYNGIDDDIIMALNSTQAIRSHCLEFSLTKFNSYSICEPYTQDYINFTILFIAFPFFITFLKMVFASIMKRLVSVRKHQYEFSKIESQIIIITIFYFLKAGLIKFVIYRIFSVGSLHIKILSVFMPVLMKMKVFLPIFPEKLHAFDDFSRQWVSHTSHKVILIGLVSFNFSILLYHFSSYFIKCFKERKASKMLTQQRMNEQLKGQELQIEFIYAETLSIFLFCMLYFGCMPIIYIFAYISILMLYWSTKHKLIKFCRKPPVYAHGINSLGVRIIFIGLLINCIVSPLYYSNLDDNSDINFMEKMGSYWHYLTLFVLIIISRFFKLKFIRLWYFIVNRIRRRFSDSSKTESYENRLKTISKCSNLQSYSMHESEEYDDILKILFLLNKNEIHRLGYFNHENVQQIRAKMEQKGNDFEIFDELLDNFYEDQRKYLEKNKREIHNPFKELRLKLEGVKEELQVELGQEQREKEMHQFVKERVRQINADKSFIKQMSKNEKFQKLISDLEAKQQKIVEYEPPQITDSRLK